MLRTKCNGCIYFSYTLFLSIESDMRPSDIGLMGILDMLPVWEEYTIPLGLSIDQVKYYESLPQQSMRGLQALQYWRDGRCGPSYPGTWNFLFQVIDAYVGPNVAVDLRKKVATKRAWTYTSWKGVLISPLMVAPCVVVTLYDTAYMRVEIAAA